MYLHVEGYLDDDDVEQFGTDAIEAGRSLDDGFEMIADLSEFRPSDEETADQDKRGQEALGDRLSAVVRVTSESTTGQMQWDRATADADYQVAKAESVEEAERLLDRR